MKKQKLAFEKTFKDVIKWVSKNEKKIYAFAFTLLFLAIVLAAFDILNIKKIFSFIIFIFIGGFFKWVVNRYRIWVEFTPIAFFCVLIAKYMGFFWVAIYIVIADIMAAFLGGQGPTGGSVPYWVWMFIFPIFALPFKFSGPILLILPIIYFLGGLFIEQFLKGGINHWRWVSAIANLIIITYFFLKLSDFFVGLII